MGKASFFCIIVVFALLLEDGSSVRKRTEEDEKEDREIAEKVNATLAEEKKKEDEEKRREIEKKKKQQDQEKKGAGQVKETGSTEKEKGQDEACPTLNQTCPEQKTCPEVKKCPVCEICPEVEPPVECDPCPEVKQCQPCQPCRSCPVINNTEVVQDQPPTISCPEVAEVTMSVPMAMLVGACASLLVTGVATAIGLLLRYVQPTISGLLMIAILILVWYLSSQYPETARELGGRAANLLREAAVALGHRMMAAIQRHQEQVGFPVNPCLFLRMSSKFQKFALRFSM
jgi:hypothetical protein